VPTPMRNRLPYLILAGVCVVLVVLIEPAGRPAAPAHEREGGLATSSDDRRSVPQGLAQVAVVSSVIESEPRGAERPTPSSAPDAARLFLAGLVLVSLAAAAKRA
jgi:hypothetical protein